MHWTLRVIWKHSKDELNRFLENLNYFKSRLIFMFKISIDNINFLDLNVSIRESHLVNDLYFKEMNCHQYLHDHLSTHPGHIKKSIVFRFFV